MKTNGTKKLFQPGGPGGPGKPPMTAEKRMLQRAVQEAVDGVVHKISNRLLDKIPYKLEECLRNAEEAADIPHILKLLETVKDATNDFVSDRTTSISVNIANMPGAGDLLAQTSKTVYAELQRLEQKQTTSGLSIEEHKSLNMLANTLLDLQARRDELTAKQRELLSKMPTEELDQLGRKLFIEAPNEKDNPSGD